SLFPCFSSPRAALWRKGRGLPVPANHGPAVCFGRPAVTDDAGKWFPQLPLHQAQLGSGCPAYWQEITKKALKSLKKFRDFRAFIYWSQRKERFDCSKQASMVVIGNSHGSGGTLQIWGGVSHSKAESDR